MKQPRSLRIRDLQPGSGRKVVPGDLAVCHFRCTRLNGELMFSSDHDAPAEIRVGARDACVGLEYGLLGMQRGGQRKVKVPPNLNYVERKWNSDISSTTVLIYEITLIELREKWDAEMEARLAQSRDEG